MYEFICWALITYLAPYAVPVLVVCMAWVIYDWVCIWREFRRARLVQRRLGITVSRSR